MPRIVSQFGVVLKQQTGNQETVSYGPALCTKPAGRIGSSHSLSPRKKSSLSQPLFNYLLILSIEQMDQHWLVGWIGSLALPKNTPRLRH